MIIKLILLIIVASLVVYFYFDDSKTVSKAQNSKYVSPASINQAESSQEEELDWVEPGLMKGKKLRRTSLLEEISSSTGLKAQFPDISSSRGFLKHSKTGPAIFTAAMSPKYDSRDAMLFAGTARAAGYTGDIVAAVLDNSNTTLLAAFTKYKVIMYKLSPICIGEDNDKACAFPAAAGKVFGGYYPLAMVRFFLYQFWALQYAKNAIILVADFRDVLFQSDPFLYHLNEWRPPRYHLVVFQEVFPNKVIYRCPFNKGWIKACYGLEAVQRVGSNTVSCSGVTLGSRDGILIYSYLMTQQLNFKVRYANNNLTIPKNVLEEQQQLQSSSQSQSLRSANNNSSGNSLQMLPKDSCRSLGMDQGFHNWLLYSKILDSYLNVRVYQQGEGPVNTVGAFFGHRAVIKKTLREWRVYKQRPTDKAGHIHNWNGDISPVVHQADRFTQEVGNYELGRPEESFADHLHSAKLAAAL